LTWNFLPKHGAFQLAPGGIVSRLVTFYKGNFACFFRSAQIGCHGHVTAFPHHFSLRKLLAGRCRGKHNQVPVTVSRVMEPAGSPSHRCARIIFVSGSKVIASRRWMNDFVVAFAAPSPASPVVVGGTPTHPQFLRTDDESFLMGLQRHSGAKSNVGGGERRAERYFVHAAMIRCTVAKFHVPQFARKPSRESARS
jgi:hypothetical protein